MHLKFSSFTVSFHHLLHASELNRKLFFNFCTYHKELFPFECCRWFCENKLTQFWLSWRVEEAATWEVNDQIVRFVQETVLDNVVRASPKPEKYAIVSHYWEIISHASLTCAWSWRFSIWDASFNPFASDRNKTIAFKHANSAGSTRIDLKRQNTSWRVRMSCEICEK